MIAEMKKQHTIGEAIHNTVRIRIPFTGYMIVIYTRKRWR